MDMDMDCADLAETTRLNQPPGERCRSETDLSDECKTGSGPGGLSLNTRRVKTYSVYVGNLPPDISKNDLTNLFKGVGPIHEVYIAPKENAPHTYGFVRYLDPMHCVKAVQDLNRWILKDFRLRVELAKETILDRSASPMMERDHPHKQKLYWRKNSDDDDIIMREVKAICSQFNQKHAEATRKFMINDQIGNARPVSPMSDINLPLFMKEVQKADSNLTPLIRFELPRVTLDLDDFDVAFGSSPGPLTSTSFKDEHQMQQFPELVTSSSVRLPKTVGFANSFMSFETQDQFVVDRGRHQPSVNGDQFVHSGDFQTPVLIDTDAFVKVPQRSSLDKENTLLPQETISNPHVQSPLLPNLQQPFANSSSQTIVNSEQSVDMNSLSASSVSLSARYQPLRSQHPGFDNYAPGVYELDEQGTGVCNVFADKSPTGLKCTLTPKGTRIVTSSSSPELDQPSSLQCTFTPKGTRIVTKANNPKLTTGQQNGHDSSLAFSQLPESVQELSLSSHGRMSPSELSSVQSSVIPMSDSDPCSSLSSDFESPTPSDQFQCKLSTHLSSYLENAPLCQDRHVSLSPPPSTMSPDFTTDQLSQNASSLDSDSSQSQQLSADDNTTQFYALSRTNKNSGMFISSPSVIDAKMASPTCTSPRLSNVGVLNPSISPQMTIDAKPLGRGRGILAFQGTIRPIGGSPQNIDYT